MTYATAIHVLELARELKISPDDIKRVCSDLRMELPDGVLSSAQAEVIRSQARSQLESQAEMGYPDEGTLPRAIFEQTPSEGPPPGQFLSDYLARSPDTIEDLAVAPPPAPTDHFPAPAPTDRFAAPAPSDSLQAPTPEAPPAFTIPAAEPWAVTAPPSTEAADELDEVPPGASEPTTEPDPAKAVGSETTDEVAIHRPDPTQHTEPDGPFDFDVDLNDIENPEPTQNTDTEPDLYALFETDDLDADGWDPDLANDLEDEMLVQMGARQPGILFRIFNERKEARSTMAGGDAHGHLATGIAEEWRPRWFRVFLAAGLLTGTFAYANIDRAEPDTATAPVAVCYEQMIAGDLSSLAPVGCSESHEFELIGYTEFPTTGLAPYPDAETFQQFGSPLCSGLFESYTGRVLDESRLQISVAPPSSSGWIDAGDRTLKCLVLDPSGPRVGSLSIGPA